MAEKQYWETGHSLGYGFSIMKDFPNSNISGDQENYPNEMVSKKVLFPLILLSFETLDSFRGRKLHTYVYHYENLTHLNRTI